MSKIATDMLSLVQTSLQTKQSNIREIKSLEAKLDKLNHEFTAFLTLLTQQNISERTSHIITDMSHVIHNLEKIGDHSENIARFQEKMFKKEISFSPEAEQEINDMMSVVVKFTEHVINYYNEKPRKLYSIRKMKM